MSKEQDARIAFLESELAAAAGARRIAEAENERLRVRVAKAEGREQKFALRMDAVLWAMVLLQDKVRADQDRKEAAGESTVFYFDGDTSKWSKR